MYQRAGDLGRGRQSERIAQRVQVSAAIVEHAAVIYAGRQYCGELVPPHQLRAGVLIAVLQLLLPGREFLDVPRLVGDVHLPGDPVAVDAMTGDALADQVDALERHIPDAARVGRADQALEFLLRCGDAEQCLGTAAARGAPANAALLEQHDAIATLGQVQRGRAARDAAADDTDVGSDCACERRPLGRQGR